MTSLTDWISNNIPDVVMDDAAHWMAILDSERCNEADRLSFARWLDEDPSHRWAFKELSEVWARLHTLSDIEPLLDKGNVMPFPGVRPRTNAPAELRATPRGSRDWSTLVVSLIVAIGVAAHLLFAAPSEKIVTQVGESRNVVLDDGSKLELNVRTSMKVTLDDKRRSIELVNGEAVFHVAEDNRPFVVQTDYGTISALGTIFNVEVIDGSLEVSVLEGRVAVAATGEPLPLTEFDDSHGMRFARDATVLDAGESLEVLGTRQRHQLLGTEEFRKRLSWREGVVVFENQPLQSVVQEIRRYAGASIHVADSHLSRIRVSGRFETGNVMQFLAQLEEKYDIFIDDTHPDWILLRTAGTAHRDNVVTQ